MNEQTTQLRSGEKLTYRRPAFVGREAELAQLESAFKAAAADHGALIMLAGEPGIGKTALCEQMASFVAEQGGLTLVGHCYAEGSAGVAYQPLVEAFGRYARERHADTLSTEMGTGVSMVARMVPAVRALLRVELTAPEDPADDRLWLLSGVLECLRSMGNAHPLLLVLEDLHDADRGTLDLLVYLARHLTDTPVLVVGTYRDVEVDRAHPLAAALAELRRGGYFQRMHISGLSVDEVQHLLASTSQMAVPLPLAEAVHRRAGGNALFAHELLRFLLAEGLVERRDGMLRRVGEVSLAGTLPEGLRDVVGQRLSRLSPQTNQVLSTASVIGREFELQVLRRLQDGTDAELERALEEAVSAGLVEERAVIGATITYRFSHGFFQQTLYDEILAPRRIRLHQQIARVVEEVNARRLEEHAAELAEHYSFSSDPGDLTKAVHYAELAASGASEVFAYGEAARQLERALAVQDLVDPEDRAKQCDLLLALGEALLPTGETDRVITRICGDALAIAEGLGDRRRAFRASYLALECLFARGGAAGAARPQYLTWAERARDHADVDSIESVRANVALAASWATRGRFREARASRLASLERARRLDDPETLFRSALALMVTTAPRHWDELVAMADEVTGWPRHGVRTQTLGRVLFASGRIRLAQGERARAEELWRQLAELADRTHVASLRLYLLHLEAMLAIVDGQLEHALVLIRRFAERAEESGAPMQGQELGLSLQLAPALYLGHAENWLTAFDEHARVEGPPSELLQAELHRTAARVICLAHLSRLDEARTVAGPLLQDFKRRADADELPIHMLAMLLETAVVLEDREAAEALVVRLAGVSHVPVTVAADRNFYTCIARHLGDAARLLGDRTGARAYYMQALAACSKIRFRPEMALAHLNLAELLLEEVEDSARSEALEHLDNAIPELRDMHMQPALERALMLRGFHADSGVHAPDRFSPSNVLTVREREIAGLIADGLSNRVIAERLVISEGTVEVHVKRILSKLGFKSRSQVAGWMGRQHVE